MQGSRAVASPHPQGQLCFACTRLPVPSAPGPSAVAVPGALAQATGPGLASEARVL